MDGPAMAIATATEQKGEGHGHAGSGRGRRPPGIRSAARTDVLSVLAAAARPCAARPGYPGGDVLCALRRLRLRLRMPASLARARCNLSWLIRVDGVLGPGGRSARGSGVAVWKALQWRSQRQRSRRARATGTLAPD